MKLKGHFFLQCVWVDFHCPSPTHNSRFSYTSSRAPIPSSTFHLSLNTTPVYLSIYTPPCTHTYFQIFLETSTKIGPYLGISRIMYSTRKANNASRCLRTRIQHPDWDCRSLRRLSEEKNEFGWIESNLGTGECDMSLTKELTLTLISS